jgi:hypothetical protein
VEFSAIEIQEVSVSFRDPNTESVVSAPFAALATQRSGVRFFVLLMIENDVDSATDRSFARSMLQGLLESTDGHALLQAEVPRNLAGGA